MSLTAADCEAELHLQGSRRLEGWRAAALGPFSKAPPMFSRLSGAKAYHHSLVSRLRLSSLGLFHALSALFTPSASPWLQQVAAGRVRGRALQDQADVGKVAWWQESKKASKRCPE